MVKYTKYYEIADSILRALNKPSLPYMNLYAKEHLAYSNTEIDALSERLYSDGYIFIDEEKNYARITTLGIDFIKRGGYETKIKKENLLAFTNTLAKAIAYAAFFISAASLYINWSTYKETVYFHKWQIANDTARKKECDTTRLSLLQQPTQIEDTGKAKKAH